MGLGLPLLVVIPLALLAIFLVVRASFGPVRRFREGLDARDARDLSPVPVDDIPLEIAPVAATLNDLLSRLKGAFDAERSFAANAAHELRTPLAGAIAQAQRLQSETGDAAAAARAADIEATLKRLTRLSERLMQLARAEGGRLRLDQTSDLRGIARIIVDEIERTILPGRIVLTLPDGPVVSDLDPDAFGILCRNLIENAIRHGTENEAIDVSLSPDGTLRVANAGPVVPQEKLENLTTRFERAGPNTTGSGLGLAIVAAISERIGSQLILNSPRAGKEDGFEVCIRLPTSLSGS
jgi:two-component system OmpR family sensor kinase